MSSKARLGWSPYFEAHAQASPESSLVGPRLFARVVEEQRGSYRLGGDFDGWADVSGRFRHDASPGEFPTVGDWVAVSASVPSAVIHRVLPRRSALSRAAAGRASEEQIIAANVDVVFIVTAAGDDLNLRRLERYLTMVWESGSMPVVVVNKIDVLADPVPVMTDVRLRLPFADAVSTSAIGDRPLDALTRYLAPGTTVALVGSSGVGKSTLVNRLLGRELQTTKPIRARDGRGRHTTAARQLIELPGGALLIDTPGMRELTPWGDRSAVDATFDDIQELASGCRYADCGHRTEPGCAVLAAVEAGRLDRDRLDHYHQLAKEAAYEAGKHDKAIASERKRRWKRAMRAQRSLYRDRNRLE